MSFLVCFLLFTTSRPFYPRENTIIGTTGRKVLGEPYRIKKSELVKSGFAPDDEVMQKNELPVYKLATVEKNSLTGGLTDSETSFVFV